MEEKTSRVKYAVGSHARTLKAQLTSTSDGLIKESVGPVGFTPPIGSTKGSKVDECFIQNGPHQLSLLHLKSLEVFITNGELSVLRSADKSFETGWVYDEIINSYLWQLCQQYPDCLYVSSAIVQILEKKGSVTKLWSSKELQNKRYIFLPWNLTTFHWILLAVDIKERKLLYLNPLEHPSIATSKSVRSATALVNFLLMTKFHTSLHSVESSSRILQNDGMSCGVYVCLYAKGLASGNDLTSCKTLASTFRKEIFHQLLGECLNYLKKDKNSCPKCNDDQNNEWIECERCKQWFHCRCAGITIEEAASLEFFTCL